MTIPRPSRAFAFALALFAASPADAGSLRFHGFGEVDRVEIPIDDVVASDFTIEFWIRGSTLLDRDGRRPGEGDFGVSLEEGRVVFGVANVVESERVCGEARVLDGAWHHVAVDRRNADGRMRVFVDGALDAEIDRPKGAEAAPEKGSSRSDGEPNGPHANRVPFVVLGAAKRDAENESTAFDGFLDELRVSNVLRYSDPFTPPARPFTRDSETVALDHFDEGPPIPGLEGSTESPFVPGAANRMKKPSFEAHSNASLGQTLFFTRTAEPLEGPIAISIVDAAGREAARLAGTLTRGSSLVVWDGKGAKGKPLVAGVYFAKLAGAGEEVVEKIVVR